MLKKIRLDFWDCYGVSFKQNPIRSDVTESVVPGGGELGVRDVRQGWYVNRVALQYCASMTDDFTSKTEGYPFARELLRQ